MCVHVQKLSQSIHWPVGPVAHDFPLAQGKLHWPGASGQWLLSQTVQVSLALAFQDFLISTNMSKSLDKCILRELKLCSHET